jgi:hypothetical protein
MEHFNNMIQFNDGHAMQEKKRKEKKEDKYYFFRLYVKYY